MRTKSTICLMILVMAMFMTGCAVKQVLKPVVQKAYDLTMKIEAVVVQTDATNLVETLKMVETPLDITKQAFEYVGSKVTDEKIKANVEKTVTSITIVLETINSVSPENVDNVKIIVLDTIETVKSSLEEVAKFIGIDLNTVLTASADPIKDMQDAMSELEKEIK